MADTPDPHGTPEGLSPLRLADALDRYRIEGPINDEADREAWQDIAARDVLGRDGPA